MFEELGSGRVVCGRCTRDYVSGPCSSRVSCASAQRPGNEMVMNGHRYFDYICVCYCERCVYQTLLVANDSGATVFAVWPRRCPVNLRSRSINISSQLSTLYRGGFPWFCARFETLLSVPAAANMVVSRPNGIRASQGSGMVVVQSAVESNSQSAVRTMFGMPNRNKQLTPFVKIIAKQNK